jgi:DNA-directed RNA polymerase subunit beta
VRQRISCRYHSGFIFASPENIDYMDVAPNQVVGISAALIPFLEHDDANRALMGSNMHGTGCSVGAPRSSVGFHRHGISTPPSTQARSSSLKPMPKWCQLPARTLPCAITTAQCAHINCANTSARTSPPASTSVQQLSRAKSSKRAISLPIHLLPKAVELALGQNVVVAFLSWEGGNFEDAILISERLVQEDRFTSVHIEKYEVEARDTKLGPEEITRDIPNVGEDAIKDLDESGIIRIGAEVGPNDILVGKITPKGEKELTPEERLLRAIFGEKSRDVKDTSLRMPHGERGKVVDVKVFTREDNNDLSAGVDMMVRVSVAQRRKITAGDKMAGRHGNKGVVSRVVPVEDMPYLEDGTPVDIILNPLGVPGRMNIGQVLEDSPGLGCPAAWVPRDYPGL